MKKWAVPILPSILAQMAKPMYYLLWSYHFNKETQNGEVIPC